MDWNADGKLDLVVDETGPITVYLNVGTKTNPVLGKPQNLQVAGKDFKKNGFQGTSEHAKIQVVDWNGDGKLDILLGSRTVLINTGTQAEPAFDGRVISLFQGRKGGEYEGELVDWDGDGELDLVTHSNCRGGVFRIYKNSGTREKPDFGLPRAIHVKGWGPGMMQSSRPTSIRVDLNGDGVPDTVGSKFRNEPMEIRMILSMPDKKMAEAVFIGGANYAPGQVMMAAEDWNNDGLMDLILAEPKTGRLMLLLNTGTAAIPNFESAEPIRLPQNDLNTWVRPEFRDVDNDGKKDLVCMGIQDDTMTYYANTGTKENPAFARVAAPLPCESQWLQWAYGWRVVDWNNDGRLDMLYSPSFWWQRPGASARMYVFMAPGK